MVSRRVHWLTLSAKVSAQPRVGLKGYTEVASHIKCARTLKLRIFDEVHSFISKPEGDMIGSVWVQGLGHEYVQTRIPLQGCGLFNLRGNLGKGVVACVNLGLETLHSLHETAGQDHILRHADSADVLPCLDRCCRCSAGHEASWILLMISVSFVLFVSRHCIDFCTSSGMSCAGWQSTNSDRAIDGTHPHTPTHSLLQTTSEPHV